MIVLIVPVVLKNFEIIQTTGTIGGFHVIVQVSASTTRDTRSSGVFLSQIIEFLCGFCKQAKHTCNMDLNPFAPEPPVTARVDPRPFYPL